MRIAEEYDVLEREEVERGLWRGPKGKAPRRLHVVGRLDALAGPALAVVGPREATPYGLSCARRFASIAAALGICVVSGGARGVDAAAHAAALDAGGATVAVVAGDPLDPHPAQNGPLFKRILDSGGAVVSMEPPGVRPRPYMFRKRDAVVAGLSGAMLAAEAAAPSGTLGMVDEALSAGLPVMAVPGDITSPQSAGSNRLIAEGAHAVVDDASFADALAAAGLA